MTELRRGLRSAGERRLVLPFIATYALAHGTALLTRDAEFAAMKRAGLRLVLVQ